MSGSRERVSTWLLVGIWLVWLVFPLAAALLSDLGTAQRVIGTLAIVCFGATYLLGFRWAVSVPNGLRRERRAALGHVALMLVLTGAAGATIGIDALGMLPFVVALAVYTWPLRAAAVLSACLLAVAVAVPLTSGQYWALLFPAIIALVSLATFAGHVQETVQDEREELRRAAELSAERDRMARDLHDVLGHSLTAVSVKAELAERLVASDAAAAGSELRAIQSLTRQALAEIRATVAGLRVARLDEELAAACRALADAGIAARTDGEPDAVDPRHRMVLAWALREAATNVVRHSEARECEVALGENWLRVSDDGAGRRGRGEGNGLRGLRERVRAAGGAVELSDRPGGGTVLSVRLDGAA